jgi:hypothetical protein
MSMDSRGLLLGLAGNEPQVQQWLAARSRCSAKPERAGLHGPVT